MHAAHYHHRAPARRCRGDTDGLKACAPAARKRQAEAPWRGHPGTARGRGAKGGACTVHSATVPSGARSPAV